MKLVIALLMIGGGMQCRAQSGKFFNGFTGTANGIKIEIHIVNSGPRCKADDSCPWLLEWWSKKNAHQVEITVTQAGFDFPVALASVPGNPAAKKDLHHPIFRVPLSTVRQIDFTLFNGTREVGRATFK